MLGAMACTEPSRAPVEPELEYRRATWLAGLDEQVTIVKDARSVAIERADGTLEGYASVLALNAARYRERFGSATPALHRRLETAAPEERIAVALRFVLPGLDDILRTPKPLRALENERAIATATEPVAAWLAEHGFVESYRSRHMPALFGTLPAKALGVVVNDPRLTRAALNERIQIAGNGEFATLDPVAEHSIDTTWNTCGGCGTGNYGAGVPVGSPRSVESSAVMT